MRKSEGTLTMVDGQGKEYLVEVHSILHKPLTLNESNKSLDYNYKGEIILKKADGTFVFRDSGLVLTLSA